jgi:hypothetical protein
MRRVLVALALGLLAVSAFPEGSAVGQGRVLYGEWNPNWQSGDGIDNSVIAGREKTLGHALDLVHWYASSSEGYADYDHVMVDAALAQGRTPLVSWGLGVPLDVSDARLDDWAKGMGAKAPATILVRLFWEFNDPPSNSSAAGWSVCRSGRSPAQLVSTWQHVVNRFRADGATNVKWVWNPDGTLGSQMYGSSCGSLGAAYPGDAYVDYRGFDSYGYPNQAQYDAENAQTGSSRPMLLGETGAHDGSSGPPWVNDLSSRLNGIYMPEVAAVVWFNEDDTAFSGNPQTQAAVRAMLSTAAFSPAAAPPSSKP